jgi:hypothetical protein
MIDTKRAAVAAALVLLAHVAVASPPASTTFELPSAAEVTAVVTARCDACAWGVEGREAVTLTLSLDGKYVGHLPLVRSGRAEYRVLIGPAAAGPHTVSAAIDRESSARELRSDAAARVDRIVIEAVPETRDDYTAISLAPILYARPNTIGRFTDVPVFMWYEREPTARGVRYRYSAIFTNEDGGTPTDRLMATWGRTTDIEYVYSVEVDAAGRILGDDLQGPDHQILAFAGRREGRHPLLWVSTDNNMVRDTGTTTVRYAPAPLFFPLNGVSREAVMDAHPWLYRVASEELAREGKIVDGAPPGRSLIPDPRRFVYVEACGSVGSAALSFEIKAGDAWFPSDRGLAAYRIVRDGCFRAAIPIGSQYGPDDLSALRVTATARPDHPPMPVRLDAVNTVFMLDSNHRPGPPKLHWTGPATISAGGPSLAIPIR